MSGQTLGSIQPVRKAVPAKDAGRRSLPVPAQEQDNQRNHNQRIVNEFQADTIELDTAPEPLMARLTLWLLATMVIAALVWASIARIDRIVTARGKIISSAPNIIVCLLYTSRRG